MSSADDTSAGVTGLSVDFGGSKIAAARFLNGEIIDTRIVRTKGDAAVGEQTTAILKLLDELNLQAADSVGIAVTGRVDSRGVWYAVNSNTLSEISNVPLKSLLQDRLGRSVSVVNDAVAGGVAEARYGAGQGVDAFAYITVSTGVGGVCVVNGSPIQSDNGLAGHIGFMSCRQGAAPCGSGRTGTVESVASGRAIERYAADFLPGSPDARSVFEYYRAQQPWAREIVVRSADAVAETSVNLVAAIGIERVVIGGSVGLADGYIDLVADAIAREPKLFQIATVAASLGQHSVLIGALC